MFSNQKGLIEARVSKACTDISNKFLDIMKEGCSLKEISELEHAARILAASAYHSVMTEVQSVIDDYITGEFSDD
jgi:hypothetical protein